MINQLKKATWAELGNQLFLIVAAAILAGWIVRFSGGDPVAIFASYRAFMNDPSIFGLCLDLGSILVIATAGSLFAAEGGVYNSGSEGQFLAGFVLSGVLVSSVNHVPIIPVLVISFLIGTLVMWLATVPYRDLSVEAVTVRGLISTFIIYSLGEGYLFTMNQNSFFPLLNKGSHPSSVIFLSIAVLLMVRYLLSNLQYGLTVKAGIHSMAGSEKMLFAMFSGGVTGLAGGAFFLCSPVSTHGYISFEGMGFLALAVALSLRGKLWFFLPLVCGAMVIPLSFRTCEYWGEHSLMVFGASLCMLMAIVPSISGVEEK